MANEPSAQVPLQLSALLIGAGIVVAALGGFRHGSLLGALIAGAGAVPAGYVAWLGMQSQGQTKLLGGMVLMLVALLLAALLVVLRVFHFLG